MIRRGFELINNYFDFENIESMEPSTLRKIEKAINASNSKELTKLISSGYINNINTVFPQLSDRTITALACESGSIECVKVLLERGADIHNHHGSSVILSACVSGNIELVKYLFGQGLNPSDNFMLDSHGVLRMKSLNNKIEIINLLLSQCKGSYKSVHGLCLLVASRAGLTDIVLSLSNRAPIETRSVRTVGMQCTLLLLRVI